MPVVVLQNVTKRFGGSAEALTSVSMNIHPGRITGMVGPDGAGKTTLIRLIAALLSPSEGSISVDGFDSRQDPEAIHDRIGYMPQRFGLYEDLSVIENLHLYTELQGLDRNETESTYRRLLAFTGLERFQKRLAGRLSGGMKQKLGLACVLLKKPRLLLLDEPSVGVDPLSRRDLWKMVKELTDDATAIVWSTAYLDEAERCDEVLLLNEGKMLYSGPPRDLTARISGRTFLIEGAAGYKRRLLSAVLRHSGTRDGVVQGDSIRVVTAPNAQFPAEILTQFSAGLAPIPAPPRFEDAFIDILGGQPNADSPLAAAMKPFPLDGSPLVLAEGLTKQFGDFTAAKDITFSVPAGRIFGLLGPNGAGKSTTFKMMCGLLKPNRGRAFVAGLDLQHASSEARARLGYMAQKFSLYGDLSVTQNLIFFAGIYGLAGGRKRETIERMVSLFNLESFLSVSAGTLPLGFKQRLALACAVMHNPPVLFLDEPTSGVDPLTRREFWRHINGMVEKGVAVVITTHFMDEAEYCDDIGLVYRGEVIASDTPDALKQSVRTDELPEPTLEDAFIAILRKHDKERAA